LFISCNSNIKKSKEAISDKSNFVTKKIDSACIRAVEDILISSPKFIELTKGLSERVIRNGGSGYFLLLENSENIETNKSLQNSTFLKYSLREDYLERAIPIAWFIFDTNKLILYEEDMETGKLIQISFDKKLLDVYLRQCK
jgi:hypothetical protein